MSESIWTAFICLGSIILGTAVFIMSGSNVDKKGGLTV